MGYRKWKQKILSYPFEIKKELKPNGAWGVVIRNIDSNDRVISTKAEVKSGLPSRVEKHISIHERVHIHHPKFGEMRTNLASFAIDPIGWFVTFSATMKSKERRAFYKQRIKNWRFQRKIKKMGPKKFRKELERHLKEQRRDNNK